MTVSQLETVAIGLPITRLGVSFFPVYLAANDPPPIATGEASGLIVDELDEASVQTLRVRNPGDKPVLVVEGEHFIGGKQNRALNATVLVPAKAELEIPVSCLEQGRWGRRQAYRRGEAYAPNRVRAAQHAGVSRSMERRGSREGDQSAVWREVDRMLHHASVESPTADAAEMHRQTYRRDPSRADAVEKLAASGPLPGQCGIVVTHGRWVAGDGPVRGTPSARRSLARAHSLVPARVTRRARSTIRHARAGACPTLRFGTGTGGARRGTRRRAPPGRQATYRPSAHPRRSGRARGGSSRETRYRRRRSALFPFAGNCYIPGKTKGGKNGHHQHGDAS